MKWIRESDMSARLTFCVYRCTWLVVEIESMSFAWTLSVMNNFAYCNPHWKANPGDFSVTG